MAVSTEGDSHKATQVKAPRKARLVSEGLRRRLIGELCSEHEISRGAVAT